MFGQIFWENQQVVKLAQVETILWRLSFKRDVPIDMHGIPLHKIFLQGTWQDISNSETKLIHLIWINGKMTGA